MEVSANEIGGVIMITSVIWAFLAYRAIYGPCTTLHDGSMQRRRGSAQKPIQGVQRRIACRPPATAQWRLLLAEMPVEEAGNIGEGFLGLRRVHAGGVLRV